MPKHDRSPHYALHVHIQELGAAIREARASQRAVESDQRSVARRAPPLNKTPGGMTYPVRPKR